MLSHLRELVNDPSPLLTAQDRKDATDLAETAQAFVSALKITSNEDGASVVIDEENVGVTPLAKPVLLDVGLRRIRVSKPGFKERVHTLEVAGGSDVVFNVNLEKEIHEGRLLINAGSGDSILIDGKIAGVGRWEGKLPSGGHSLQVTRPDMVPYQSEILIQDDKLRTVNVTLHPVPFSIARSTWLWIGGGAIVTAGAVVGAILLFRPEQEPAVQGTLPPGTVQLSFGGRR
ncbi:PEGA domain-containing protein [Sorangium sp. So ce385]|uniref:PEGA domain-containing protein n=1 Tax=Sorangium sp. So ce385 TaxID=3133308 RepID=UPI003F5AF1AA